MVMLYRSARLRLDCSEQVATLWLDAGVVSRALLHDLGEAIDVMRRCRAADVLVLRGSCTGPDLDEYAGLTDAESRRGFSRLGQEILQRLANLSTHIATVAYIDGECTNAGLELALACDFRLAVARPESRIGFDFLDRGLLPCWGATQRLPRLVGPHAALDLLLGGNIPPARAAKKRGLVDHAFGPRSAKTELWWFVADVQAGRRARGRAWWRRLRDAVRPLPRVAGREEPRRSLIDAVCRGWRQGIAAGYAAERTSFAAHALHPSGVWRRQVARQRLERARDWIAQPASRQIGVTQLDEQGTRVAVATLVAGASLAVGRLGPGEREQLGAALRQAVDDGWLNIVEAEQRLERVISGDLSACELVILTGPDSLQATDLFEFDRQLPPSALLVITAAALPLEPLAAATNHPQRVLGVIFSEPQSSKSTAAVLPTPHTEECSLARVVRWLEHCGHSVDIADPALSAGANPVAA